MRGARYVRLIPWTLRSGSEQVFIASRKKERNTLTLKGGPCFFWANSHLLRSLASVNCLCTPCSSLTPCHKDIYLHTDEINMPATPDGHTRGYKSYKKASVITVDYASQSRKYILEYLVCKKHSSVLQYPRYVAPKKEIS